MDDATTLREQLTIAETLLKMLEGGEVIVRRTIHGTNHAGAPTSSPQDTHLGDVWRSYLSAKESINGQ